MGLRSKLDTIDRRFMARPGECRGEPPRFGEHPLLLIGSVALLMVPVMSILLFQTGRNELEDNRARAMLQRDGVVVVGTVTGLRHPQRWNVFPDAIRVEFMTETERRSGRAGLACLHPAVDPLRTISAAERWWVVVLDRRSTSRFHLNLSWCCVCQMAWAVKVPPPTENGTSRPGVGLQSSTGARPSAKPPRVDRRTSEGVHPVA